MNGLIRLVILLKLLLTKGLYFEILIVWLLAEWIIQAEPFPKDFCMFFIIIVQIYNYSIDRVKHIINVSCMSYYFWFWTWIKICIFRFVFAFYLLNTKPNVATNFKTFNWVNKFISVILIADSVSLRFSSGLNEFKISTLQVLA